MKFLHKRTKLFAILLTIALALAYTPLMPQAYAATSPTLSGASGYSVLGGAAVTNTGATTTNGSVGVSPGTSIDGGITAGGGIHSNDASAIAAQADTVSVFTALDQTCTNNYSSGQDLTLISPLVPGVYCSAGSFLLTGNLTLSGSSGVWIFKTVSTLITSSGSSVTGGDPCNVWWRIGSAATLATTTSFIGNIVLADADEVTALQTSATLNGRVLAQAAATVTLDTNTITGPTCSATAGSSSSSSTSSSTNAPASQVCPNLSCVTPLILESRRVDADSIFLSWGPYAGIDTFIIRYGLENGNWLYSTTVTGFSTTLNDLPPNQPIWVLISPTDNCSIGPCGEARLVGGPMLPNTGVGATKQYAPWLMLIDIFAKYFF